MKNTEDNVLTIGFTAGTLFDMKEAEKVFENAPDKDKQKLYREYFKDMNAKNQTFKVGPALGLYIALQELKSKIPESVLTIRFGVSSKFDTAHPGANTLFNSISHYLMKDGQHHAPDYHSLTGGFEQASAHKIQGADLVFTSSDKSADLYYNNGIASVYIPNRSPELNMNSYKNRKNNLNIYCDYDGVIGDVESESVYQAAKKLADLNAVNTFRDHEVSKAHIPMELGPLGDVLKKLGRVVEYYHDKLTKNEIKENNIPFKTILLTARGGGAAIRAFNTLNTKGITLSQSLFMDGKNKNDALTLAHKKEITLFLDDGRVHFDRAVELENVIAGYVPNELTVGKINIDERMKRLTEQLGLVQPMAQTVKDASENIKTKIDNNVKKGNIKPA